MMESVLISDHAKGCIRLLDLCCSNPEDPTYELAEDQLGRFKLCASNIGVFAGRHASLDYRLRDAPDVAHAVIGMLDVLQVHATRALNSKPDSCPENDETHGGSGVPPAKTSASASSTQSSSVAVNSPRLKQLCAVERAIDVLHNLSLAIRKAGSKNPLSQATNFIIRDEEGNDINANFDSFVRRVLEVRLPHLNEALRERISTAICFRRRRFLYARAHQQELKRKADVPKYQAPPSLKYEGSNVSLQEVPVTLPTPATPSLSELKKPASTQWTDTTASALDPKWYNADDQLSHTSTATSISPVVMEDIEIPPAPELKPGSKEQECPYCCLVLEASEFTNSWRWKRHVERDLEPYICIFEECPNPNEFFKTAKEWLQHMRKPHPTGWICHAHTTKSQDRRLNSNTTFTKKGNDDHCNNKADSNESAVFGSREELQSHMKSSHGNSFTTTQIATLSKFGARLAQMFTICPFCNCLPEGLQADDESGSGIINALQCHVAKHLLSLALMSLPWREDVKEINTDNASGTGFEAKQ